jgi:tetratricopeptide (TPR) repeat protein
MAVIDFFRAFFKPKSEDDDTAIVEENFETDFRRARDSRFLEEEYEKYGSAIESGQLKLQLRSERLFAWSQNHVHRYDDFMAEAEIGFNASLGDTKEGAAAGLLFRYADEDHFYTAMVSSRGQVRLDLVFNGTPRPLLAWTETGVDTSQRFILRLIARDTRFILMLNERVVAQAEDDSIAVGYLAFAAQNYDVAGGITAFMEEFCVESRKLELETAYSRFTRPPFMESEALFRMAETYVSMGQALPALISLNKIETLRPLSPQEGFLRAEAQIYLCQYDEALASLNAVLDQAPEDQNAQTEKANALYLRGDYLGLKTYIDGLLEKRADAAVLWNLKGHAEHNLGSYAAAAEAYEKAAELDPTQPIYSLNAARSRDSVNDAEGAFTDYIKAARGFFAVDDLDDLSLIITRLNELKPESPQSREWEAKALYREGKLSQAEKLLDGLIKQGAADSSAYYLEALILSGRNERAKAIPLLREAISREPDYPLYRFRLAESLFLSGQNATEALAEALRVAPDDGWVLNLAAQMALAQGDLETASAYLERAVQLLPGESAPIINLSELLSREGRTQAALEALSPFKESASARNQAGNILCSAGDLELALKEYNVAARLAPDEMDFILNRAACLLELGRYSDAETDARHALEATADGAGNTRAGTARALILMGQIAEVYGDYPRAEISFRAALDAEPEDERVWAALADIYLNSRRLAKAEQTVADMENKGHARARAYRERLTDLTYNRFSCAGCGREWLVPKDLPPQGLVRLSGELPDSSPAGKCPQCGKVYCVGCRKDHLENDRFTCPECAVPLKLSEDGLKYLAMKHSGL